MKNLRYNWSALVQSSVATVVLLGTALAPAGLAVEQLERTQDLQLSTQDLLSQASDSTSADDLVVDIEVTPEQQAELEAIFAQYNPLIEAATADLATAQSNFLEVAQPEAPTEDLQAASQDILEADQALNALLFERLLAVRDVLTVEQRVEFRQQLTDALEGL